MIDFVWGYVFCCVFDDGFVMEFRVVRFVVMVFIDLVSVVCCLGVSFVVVLCMVFLNIL